ncbi:MAG: type II toxin-antitoxin system VapC family toxin [Bacteroidia bacterium]|nr:type II toxin-antitoxin system VapC family toxin [Bacteroidia bacterium]
MGQRYLIDPNVISHLFADRLPKTGKTFVTEVVNEEFIISVAVEIEVLTYHETPDKMPLIKEFINLATILPLDKAVTKKAIELRRDNRKLKLGDAIIAATAIVHQLTLMTNNTKDFIKIDGLQIIDPHQL